MAFISGTYTNTGGLLTSLGAWLATQGWAVDRSIDNGQDTSKFCFSLAGRYFNFWTWVDETEHDVLNLPGEGDFIMGKISLAYNVAYEPWQQVPNFAHDAGQEGGAYNREDNWCAKIDCAGRSGSYRFYYNSGEVSVILVTNLGLYRHFSFGKAQVLDPFLAADGITYITVNNVYGGSEYAGMHPYSSWAFSHSPYTGAIGHIHAVTGATRPWAAMASNFVVNDYNITDGFPHTSHNISQNYGTHAIEFGFVPSGYNSYGLMSYLSPIRIYLRDYTTGGMRLIGHLETYCAMNVRYVDAGEAFTLGVDTWRSYPFVKKQLTEVVPVGDYNSFWSGIAVKEA